MSQKVRVRFAPSPTGGLHIGGVRTALYNYLFAKKNGGDFLLRIEDTDQTRFVEGAEDYIREALSWCGIAPNEGGGYGGEKGPYKQSERKAIYKKYAEQLVETGHAYYAFDTPEELQAEREKAKANGVHTWQYDSSTRGKMKNSLSFTEEEVNQLHEAGVPAIIRFKMPEDETITFVDEIRGEVNYESKLLDDKVLFKADGMPTYHLANIVDDHLMEISHIIRGEEWLPSAPLHVMLYRAFGWKHPKFAHLPLILKPVGNGKLSKRDGDKMGFPVFPLAWKDPKTNETSLGYREEGYLPEAVVNMLLMLGWNEGTDQEIYSLEEAAQVFSLERVIKAGAKFSPEKAKWFNEQYLRNKSDEELLELVKPLVKERGININEKQLINIIKLTKERSTLIPDLIGMEYLFEAPTSYDTKTVRKKWKDDTASLVTALNERWAALPNFTEDQVNQSLMDFMEEREIGFGRIGPGLRLAMTGVGGGPSLPAIAALLGKEETIKRIENGIKNITKLKEDGSN